jgi:hypothetical protein
MQGISPDSSMNRGKAKVSVIGAPVGVTKEVPNECNDPAGTSCLAHRLDFSSQSGTDVGGSPSFNSQYNIEPPFTLSADKNHCTGSLPNAIVPFSVSRPIS